MSKRSRRRKREKRRARQDQRTASVLELMNGLIERKYRPLIRPQDARNLLLNAHSSGFEEKICEDLSSRTRPVALATLGETIGFIVVAVAAVMSVGWWSILVVAATAASLAIVRHRSLFRSQIIRPLVLLSLAGMVASVFVWRYGIWYSVLCAAVPVTWFFRRLSYRLAKLYVVHLAMTNPAAFAILFDSDRLALLEMDKLDEAQESGNWQDYPLVITAHDDAEHD